MNYLISQYTYVYITHIKLFNPRIGSQSKLKCKSHSNRRHYYATPSRTVKNLGIFVISPFGAKPFVRKKTYNSLQTNRFVPGQARHAKKMWPPSEYNIYISHRISSVRTKNSEIRYSNWFWSHFDWFACGYDAFMHSEKGIKTLGGGGRFYRKSTALLGWCKIYESFSAQFVWRMEQDVERSLARTLTFTI